MTAAQDRRGQGYGSIAIDNLPTPQVNEGVPRERARSLLFLSMLAGTAALLLTFVVAYNGQYESAEMSMPAAGLLETQGSSKHDKKYPDKQHWYKDQLVDHFFQGEETATWSHRYYQSKKHFGGPGHPIFLVLGGEGPAVKLFYPFIQDHLAKTFKAYVLQPEHRFYGKSQPIKIKKDSDFIGLLTPEQAMADFLRLLKHKQKQLGCSTDRSSKKYCPVITVGGSYPGFLSAMMRLVHPDVIDIGYASSAPLHLYAQELDSRAYFDKVTETAAQYDPRCPAALLEAQAEIVGVLKDTNTPFQDVAERMGVCVQKIPDYITNNEIFSQETMMIVGANNADFNMDNYPPTDETNLAKECQIFMDESLDSYEKMKAFFGLINEEEDAKCFDYHSQIPDGANGTISTSDWTGAGPGPTGRSWEFQLCSDLIVRAGFSEESMFVEREWTLEWLTKHCESRGFGVEPQPYRLVDQWGFNDLVGNGASRILFTNGLNDGWSVLSILEPLSDSLPVINFPNGAHHSDLSHEGPSDADTDDMKLGFVEIANILGIWLDEIKEEA